MNTTQGRSRQGLIVVLMIAMPLIVLVFLGSQMALQQVVNKSATYQDMPEMTEVAALRHLPPNTRVMLRGQLVFWDWLSRSWPSRLSRASCRWP